MTQIEARDQQALIDSILDSQISIPPQPAILLEIDRLVSKPNNNLTAIGHLIGKDVGVSAAIFKLVNSPFYGLPCQITSIPKAIATMGLAQVTNIVKGLALRKVLSGHELAYEKFWEHSGEIATLSSIIAGKRVSACNIAMDQAYTAGLFHECGVPILMQRFPEYSSVFRLNQGSNWPDFRKEDLLFNTDHAVVGHLVAKYWNLPDFICQAVRFHHERLNVEHSALTLVSILQLAQHIHKDLHQLDDTEWPLIKWQALDEIGVRKEDSAEFIEDVIDVFNRQQPLYAAQLSP